MQIYCCGCQMNIEAKLVDGKKIYPHRTDLKDLPFWQCDECNNFVGCHYKTKNPTDPLGSIATSELKKKRQQIHATLDPLWINNRKRWADKKISRKMIYGFLSNKLGYEFHAAEVNSLQEAERILFFINDFKILQIRK